MRHLAIGDIHGCATALSHLLDFVSPQRDDTIVTLGDYVDRGPNTRDVLELLINLGEAHNLVPLRGNHEIMMLDSRDSRSWFDSWLGYGGDATLRSYSVIAEEPGSFAGIPDAHMDFLENRLLPWFECDTHFFVHAGVEVEKPLEEQSDAILYWRKYGKPELHCSGKIMVCGHTLQETGMAASNPHSICIDTGAWRNGWLSCLDVESGTVWQANEGGKTRQLQLGESF